MMSPKNLQAFIFCISIFLFLIFFSSCKNNFRNKTHPEVLSSSIDNGRELAKQYCQLCHALPDPSLLDTKTWEKGILPQMGPRLGIFQYGFDVYPSYRNDRNLDKNYYPSHPLLNINQWKNIIDYYIATSPDSMPAQKREHPINMNLSLFYPETPSLNYQNSSVSYVKINPKDTTPILISDVIKQNIYFLDKQLNAVDSIHSNGPIVNIDFIKDTILACNIGLLNPNNGKFGKAEIISLNAKGKAVKDSLPLFDSLQRPVQVTAADLNNDGKNDYIICEFGFLTGALSWQENLGNNNFKRHVLRPIPGAIKAYVQDYNHDGLQDIWVLFAQGDEGVFLFTNKGNGQFSQEEVLRFPPEYGSSYFELDDFNNDGYPDILYTCGDNADYSSVLKPYHGVYIFLNDKTNHFNQKFFFSINGCYKAIAKDFDGDGDLDIATISFFADYQHQPEEGFVYLKNEGNFNYLPYSLSAAENGRWLTMDAGDIDGDGRVDIILGNFSIGPTLFKSKYDWKKSPPFLILKNTGK